MTALRRLGEGGLLVGTSLAAAGAIGLAAFAWGTLVERTRFTLREVSVPVLAPGSAPIRVLHLSDLHMAPWQKNKQEWVRSLAALKPDLVVDTGDNLGHDDGVTGIEYALAPFRGIPGVFVNGSNDYIGPQLKNPFTYFGGPSSRRTVRREELDTDALRRVFADLGWTDINNAAEALDLNGTHVEFFGVDDPHIGRDRLDLITRAIDDLRANDPLGDDVWPDPEEAADFVRRIGGVERFD